MLGERGREDGGAGGAEGALGLFTASDFSRIALFFRNTSCSPSPRAKHVCQAVQQKINEEVSLRSSSSSSSTMDCDITLIHQVDRDT